MSNPKTELVGGGQVTDDHRDIKPNGQQKGYVVLTQEELDKGFVRPYRDKYVHKTCNTSTTMGASIASTYARDPKFYGATFCCKCKEHFPVDQFHWYGSDEIVGS